MDEDGSSLLQKCIKIQENVESQLNDREDLSKKKCLKSAGEAPSLHDACRDGLF